MEERSRVVRGREGGEEEEGGIDREEIKRVVRKLKDEKAVGEDGIMNEVWKYGGEEVEKSLWKICNREWEGEGWPEGWKEGVVVPIVKRGVRARVEDYRGVTLTQTAYKVYTMVLEGRLREEMERKDILPPSQAGFRKGRSTIDNIYVLNYLINRQIERRGGKVVVLFVDMKAAFDSMDRETLLMAMRERGVRESLVKRCGEVLRKTISKVKVGEKEGKKFWMERGLRQGCPLSPCLFTLLLADIDEELEKGGWSGIELGGKKVYSLAYADDVVLLAKDEEGMKGMMGKLEKYLDKKKLEVNTEKTKVMRCKRGGGRKKGVNWRWKGNMIEEVNSYKYLGYTVTANGRQEGQVEERLRKGSAILGQV